MSGGNIILLSNGRKSSRTPCQKELSALLVRSAAEVGLEDLSDAGKVVQRAFFLDAVPKVHYQDLQVMI